MFTQSAVVEITGIKPATLQNWVNRGVLSIPPSFPGREKSRRYRPIDVVRIAFVLEMNRFGITPKDGDWFFDEDTAQSTIDHTFNYPDGHPADLDCQIVSIIRPIGFRPCEGEVAPFTAGDLAFQFDDCDYLVSKDCPRTDDRFLEKLEDEMLLEKGLPPVSRAPRKAFDFSAFEPAIVFYFERFCNRIARAMAARIK